MTDSTTRPPVRKADQLLKPDQVAERLAISTRSVHRLVAEGHLPKVTVGGHIRIAESDLAAFQARNRN